MWQTRSPRTHGDRLWHYIAGLRRGEDHDPEEELRSLLPMARLVSDALKGGGEGPEHLSEARLAASIARSEARRAGSHRRNWVTPSLAAAAWILTTLSFGLGAYQYGLNRGAVHVPRPDDAPLPEIARAISDVVPTGPEPKIVIKRAVEKKHSSRRDRQKRVEIAAVPSAPPVRVDELASNGTDSDPSTDLSDTDASTNSAQNNLMRVGSSQLTQGQWDKAASTFEEAADQKPEDESALDALHLSGNIAETALNDSRRAGQMYLKEADLARRIIERRKDLRDAPAEPVKMRLARAMTSAGLLERNPIMIRKATQETGASGSPVAADN